MSIWEKLQVNICLVILFATAVIATPVAKHMAKVIKAYSARQVDTESLDEVAGD